MAATAPPAPLLPLILIVDDEPAILAEMADWMEIIELPCVTAASGQAALRCLAQYPSICLIITDIRMPVMDGYEILRQAVDIRSDGSDLTFIILTGDLTNKDRDSITDLKIEHWLTKPADLDELEALIRSSLR
jgi:CheY-like chemotaxis protein